MYLFNYARSGELYSDKPHVSIKIWSWCQAWCDCDFSYKKIKNIVLYKKDSIIRNVDYISDNFSLDFEIFLVWLNLLKYDEIEEILDYIIKKWRKFKLQIPHNMDKEDYSTLSFLYKKYGSFDCSVPKTIDTYIDLSNLISYINDLKKINISWKIYFDIFLDINKYKKIIETIISKLSTNKSNNIYNCIIWKYFDLKFHDLSWKIDNENQVISNLQRDKCLMKDYFYLDNSKIFLYDHIEVWPNWAFTFHDNLCYLWHFEISNTSFSNFEIISHFDKYKDYLNNITKCWKLSDQCYKCIKNQYNYNKSNSEYVY